LNIACYIRDDTVFQDVQNTLGRVNFHCDHFHSETSLLRALRHQNFDLILVDMGTALPDKESMLSWLNCRTGESTPVVLLSPARNPAQAAQALDAGADDFIVMPFDPLELVARLRVVLRRNNKRNIRRAIEVSGFILDRETSSFSDRGTIIELTPREFTMAWLLFSTPGIYISREAISVAIWGVDSEIAGRTIEQHVYKLRKKLQLGVKRGIVIRTAYSLGYRIELLSSQAHL
jgi:DNA-binding response OmpR family regulator